MYWEQLGPAILYHIGFVLPSAFLCFFTVREKLKKGLLFPLVCAAASSVPLAFWSLWIGETGFSASVAVIPYLVLAFWFYTRQAAVPPLKLLFIMLAVVNFLFFTTAMQTSLLRIFFDTSPDAHNLYYWIDSLMEAAVALIALPPAAIVLRTKVWPVMRDGGAGSFKALWALPLLFTVLIAFVNATVSEHYLASWPYTILILLLEAGAFFCYWLIMHMLREAGENAQSRERITQMDTRLQMQSERFSEIAAHVDEMRILRHDMRHHLSVLAGLLNDGQPDKTAEYLREYSDELKDASDPPLCGNFVVDVMARRYAKLAREAGIDAEFSLALPPDTGVADTDLCIVLGNLIENAMNALKKQKDGRRILRVKARLDENRLLIAVDNSIGDEEEQADLRSFSGLGIPSVRAIAEKYGGMASFERKGTMFEASVLLYRVNRVK